MVRGNQTVQLGGVGAGRRVQQVDVAPQVPQASWLSKPAEILRWWRRAIPAASGRASGFFNGFDGGPCDGWMLG
jgi:hypothetical protein